MGNMAPAGQMGNNNTNNVNNHSGFGDMLNLPVPQMFSLQ